MVSPHQPRVHLPQNQRWALRFSSGSPYSCVVSSSVLVIVCAAVTSRRRVRICWAHIQSEHDVHPTHMVEIKLLSRKCIFMLHTNKFRPKHPHKLFFFFLIPDGQCCPAMRCERKCSQMLKLKDMICEISSLKCLNCLDHCIPGVLHLVTSHFDFLERFKERGRRPRLRLNICWIRFRCYLVLGHFCLSHVRSSFLIGSGC